MEKTIHLIFFSPTGTSAKIARAVGAGLAEKLTKRNSRTEEILTKGRNSAGTEKESPLKETDLTCDREAEPLASEGDIAVIAAPVYAGRVTPAAVQRLKRFRGNGTPAVLAVIYGNRDYEDALVELRDLAAGLGFYPLSAGAFIGEHSYSRPAMPVAEGRPDEDDLKKAREFGMQSADKYIRLSNAEAAAEGRNFKTIDPETEKTGPGSNNGRVVPEPFYIKGNVPYREVPPSAPSAPLTLQENCTCCGLCLDICPSGAVYTGENGEIVTDTAHCIKCCACVKNCPNDARIYNTPYTAMLHTRFAARREPELFY